MGFTLLGILSSAASGGALVSAGFFVGGQGRVNTIKKLDFETDTFSLLATTISNGAERMAGVSNSGVSGYTAGGNHAFDVQNRIFKLAYPSETASTLGATLSIAREQLSGMSNSGVAGYFAGGAAFSGGWVLYSTNDKLDYSTESRSTVAGLSIARRAPTGMSNSGVAGYSAGGDNGSDNNIDSNKYSIVNKLTFATDTMSTLATGMSYNGSEMSAMANKGVAGYVAGDTEYGPNKRTLNVFAFPTETRTVKTSELTFDCTNSGGGVSNHAVSGYFHTSGNLNKFAFPSETRSAFTAGITVQIRTSTCESSPGL